VFFSDETLVREKYPSDTELDGFQLVDPWKSNELVLKSRKVIIRQGDYRLKPVATFRPPQC
jgi:hypothetical protein